MNVVLPKSSRGVSFGRLVDLEFNNFEVERVLPSLYYRVVTRGRTRAHRPNDPKNLNMYRDILAARPDMQGFDDADGQRLLDRWLRAEIIRVASVGKARVSEQIDYLVPLTLLVHKTGLPQEAGRQRNIDSFVYGLMVRFASGSLDPARAEDEVRRIFIEALGTGITIDPGPTYDGRYDEKTAIDIGTLLELRYLDGFVPTRVSEKEKAGALGPALPAVAAAIGEDTLSFLSAYASHLPSGQLVRGLLALLNFQLFVYSTKLWYATNALVADSRLPAAMRAEPGSSPPNLYCDFTHEPGRTSDEIARASVDRDLEELGRFYDTLIYLRTLNRFADMVPEARPLLEPLNDRTPEFLAALWGIRDHPLVLARGHSEVEAIKAETLEANKADDSGASWEEYVSHLWNATGGNQYAMAAAMTADAQRKNVMTNLVKWFWSAGGLRVPYGLLVGNLTGRRSWRYQMSDDLLSALVHLALVDGGGLPHASATIRPRVTLSAFLQFLEVRFGVIVGRPPEQFESASAREAARQNLMAMKRRLRQMGHFTQLSDDFNAQYLTIPRPSAATA